jgi:hypothetical protein
MAYRTGSGDTASTIQIEEPDAVITASGFFIAIKKLYKKNTH